MCCRQQHAERAKTSAEHNKGADYHPERWAALAQKNKLASEAHIRAATAHYRAANFIGSSNVGERARKLSQAAWAAEVRGLSGPGLEPVILSYEKAGLSILFRRRQFPPWPFLAYLTAHIDRQTFLEYGAVALTPVLAG
jgi:hypothetical protein